MFCPTDKVLMRPVPGKGLACPKCGATKDAAKGTIIKGKSVDDEKKSVMVDSETEMSLLPTTTDYQCEKCGSNTAYYYMRQTRAADEATTRFLICANQDCKHKWRDYR